MKEITKEGNFVEPTKLTVYNPTSKSYVLKVEEGRECAGTYANMGHCLDKVVAKLGPLEFLEGRLGFDLQWAVSVCNKANEQRYVYIKEDWGITTLPFSDELDIELFHHRLYSNSRGVWHDLDLFEYGKTWAFTKRELE